LILRVLLWPFGSFIAALLIIAIALLVALVAIYAAKIALSQQS